MKKLLIFLLFPCFLNAQTFRTVTMPSTDIPVNGNIIIRSGNLWRLGDTALLNLSYKNALLARVFYSDTANILAAYRNALLGKVWYSDTSNMLAAYRAALLTFAPLSHTQNASTILAGTFGAGKYIFPDTLQLADASATVSKILSFGVTSPIYVFKNGTGVLSFGSATLTANYLVLSNGFVNVAGAATGLVSVPSTGPIISSNKAAADNVLTVQQLSTTSKGMLMQGKNDDSTVFNLDRSGAGTFSTSVNVGMTLGSLHATGSIFKASGTSGREISVQTSSSTTTDRNALSFIKTAGTVASPTTVASSDQIGFIGFKGYDGTSAPLTAMIQGYVDGAVSTGVVPTAIDFITGTTSANRAPRMVVKSDGNISVVNKVMFSATNTAAGTTGNQVINKPTGTVNIAAAGTSVTVTNSYATTSSIVYAVLRTNDANAVQIKSVVPGSGSFVINLSVAPAAEVSIGFIVFN